MEKKEIIFEKGVAVTENFSSIYADLNHEILNHGNVLDSRNGEVREVLDFKTTITNPYKRCVGGYNRNINIYFLLAEAIWIALGKKDVKFLTIFNKNMAEFSDDGETFHAPYGYRLRNWGLRSENKYLNDNLSLSKGYDQIIDGVRLLAENPNTRQVVFSIWNPELDLGYKTKDIPCNDLIMIKIRNGKLITTIQNRSNDLHWGLPTNIFQFSFLTELIAMSLGIELGTQTHNSQSLHIYSWSDIAKKMEENYNLSSMNESIVRNIYDNNVPLKMDFNFTAELAVNRFKEIDFHLNIIYRNILSIYDNMEEDRNEILSLKKFSSYLHIVYQLLKIYLVYQKTLITIKDEIYRIPIRLQALDLIENLELENKVNVNIDIFTLAKNFIVAKLPIEERKIRNLDLIGLGNL